MCNPCWAMGALCKVVCCAVFFVLLALLVTAYLLIGSNDELEDWGDVMTSSELWTFDVFLIVLAIFLALLFFLGVFLVHSLWEGTCTGFFYCAHCRCCAAAWARRKRRNQEAQQSQGVFVPLSSIQIDAEDTDTDPD